MTNDSIPRGQHHDASGDLHPQANGAQGPQLDILTHYNVLRILGRGWEGTVYLVEDKESLNKQVLKIFHKPRSRDEIPGLVIYSAEITTNDYGLPAITLLQRSGEVIGLQYPYVKLQPVHERILNSSEQVAQSVVGAFCQMQSHLISEYDILIHDAPLDHFMVASDGRWHYLDFGVKVRKTNDPEIPRYGLLGYGLADLLLSIHNKNIRVLMPLMEGYSYDEPCIYCMTEELDAIAAQHAWVQKILLEVRRHKPSVFHDAEFYRRLGEHFPTRVPWPALVLSTNSFLFWVRQVRGRLGSVGPVESSLPWRRHRMTDLEPKQRRSR